MSLRASLTYLLPVAVLVQAWLYVCLAPYTKVEESFTLQAVHDILAFGIGPHGRTKFDHITFPGAVPRSFVGPFLLSVISYPVLVLTGELGFIKSSADAGLAVRLVLATAYVTSLVFFALVTLSTQRSTGRLAAERTRLVRTFFLLITLTQFSNLFWASRTTPNGLISPLINVALACLLTDISSGQARWCVRTLSIAALTSSAIVARSEIVGLLLPAFALTVVESANTDDGVGKDNRKISKPEDKDRWTSIIPLALISATCGLLALATSVLLDTYMWGRPFLIRKDGILWPELEAIVFNVLDGKSAEWGVSPIHSYFTTYVPKLVSFPILFIPAALLDTFDRRSNLSVILRRALFVSLAHISLLSLLGHKEARFVAYTVPLLNLVAATGASNVWQTGRSQSTRLACRFAVLLVLGASGALTVISTLASVQNYPGGEALAALHRLKGDRNATVHIDVLPAMTGVSLFQSLFSQHRSRHGAFGLDALPNVLPLPDKNVRWAYDKTEGLYSHADGSQDLTQTFSYIVSDDRSCHGLPSFQLMRDDQGKVLRFSQYAGLHVLSLRETLTRMKALASKPRQISTIKSVATILPLQIKQEDVVWLCERAVSAV